MKNETANEAYQRTRIDIHNLVSHLDELLEAHRKRQTAEPKNWGLHGDLTFVYEHLCEAVKFLGHLEDDDIARALEEMRSMK